MKLLSMLLASAGRWIRRPGHPPCGELQFSACAPRTKPAPAPADDFSLDRFNIDDANADRLPRYALSDQNFVVDELEFAAALDRGHLSGR